MIRILLAEDQMLVRKGIVELLSMCSDFEVVAEVADGDEALAAFDEVQPDVLVMDIRMPGKSGIDVIRELAERMPNPPPSLLLTTFDEDDLFFAALRVGAAGFLLKDVSLDRLAAAIRDLHAGKSLLQPALTERAIRHFRQQPRAFEVSESPEKLTPREHQILRLVAAGYSNREIGAALVVAEGSVRNQISNILGKLGVRDRIRAVLRGVELGYL